MKYFVYYDDDYIENGGVGFGKFDSLPEATKFIEDRISQDKTRNIYDYKIIVGKQLIIEIVETVTKITAHE
jgi:hypothetical protein